MAMASGDDATVWIFGDSMFEAEQKSFHWLINAKEQEVRTPAKEECRKYEWDELGRGMRQRVKVEFRRIVLILSSHKVSCRPVIPGGSTKSVGVLLGVSGERWWARLGSDPGICVFDIFYGREKLRISAGRTADVPANHRCNHRSATDSHRSERRRF